MRSQSTESSNERTLRLLHQAVLSASKASKEQKERRKYTPTKSSTSQERQGKPKSNSVLSHNNNDGGKAAKDRERSKGKKEAVEKLTLKSIGEQLRGLKNLEQIANFTSNKATSHREKPRIKKSPPRDSNSDNMIPQL